MKRRVILLGCTTVLTGFTGCIGGDGQDGQGPAPSGETPTRHDAEEAFRTTVSSAVAANPSFSFADDTWSVSYHYDLCCAEENLRPHQLNLATNFTAVQPDNVTVALTTTHECQVVEWEVPPEVARRYREGELTEEELRNHIAESSERTSTC